MRDLAIFSKKEAGGKVEVYIVPGAVQTFNSREWESKVITKTVDWFRNTLAGQ